VKTRRDLTRDFQRLPSEVTRYEEPVTRATMRVAVLADVHGNRLALDAILINLERRGGAEHIVNFGDCVSGPLWPGETMERLAALNALTTRGNHDRQVATLALAELIASDRFAHDALAKDLRLLTRERPPRQSPHPIN
jgi:predicted phosphodiesterase